MCSQNISNSCHVSSMHSTPMLWEKFFSFFPRIFYKMSEPWVLVKNIRCKELYAIILLEHIYHLKHHRSKSAKSTSTIFESIFFNFDPNHRYLFDFDHIQRYFVQLWLDLKVFFTFHLSPPTPKNCRIAKSIPVSSARYPSSLVSTPPCSSNTSALQNSRAEAIGKNQIFCNIVLDTNHMMKVVELLLNWLDIL